MSSPPLSATARFEALDMLRGLAAVLIVVFHAYWTSDAANPWNKAWLGVDLFFALSGFVLAHAYLDRLRTGMPLSTFMKLRLIRLYPLYIAGTLIGAALWWLLQVRAGEPPDLGLLALTLGWQAAFLPVLPAHSIDGNLFYPLNGPAWSLFFELVINLCLVLSARFLRPAVLAAIIAAAAIWLIAVAVNRQTLDVGWSWPTIWDGGARTAFSFFAGVALYRLHLRRKAPAVSTWLIAAALLGWITFGRGQGWLFDLASVFLVFPLLIWFGASATGGAMTRRFGLWSGTISYPIYALHVPQLDFYYRAFGKLVGNSFPDHEAQAVAGYVVTMIAVAWCAARFFDDPVRRFLGRRMGLSKVRGSASGQIERKG